MLHLIKLYRIYFQNTFFFFFVITIIGLIGEMICNFSGDLNDCNFQTFNIILENFR